MTHAAGYGRGAFGNVSELFRSGALIHRGVGHENGVRLSYKNMDAEGGLSFLGANHLIDFSDRLRIGAGEASDHGFGFVEWRSEEGRVGNACVRTCRSGWLRNIEKKNTS